MKKSGMNQTMRDWIARRRGATLALALLSLAACADVDEALYDDDLAASEADEAEELDSLSLAARPCPDGECGGSAPELSINFKAQETDFYCGPASTRMALSVRMPPASLPSQKQLASNDNLMTDAMHQTDTINRVVNVLNKHLGVSVFTAKNTPGRYTSDHEATLRTDVRKAIDAHYAMVANVRGKGKETPYSYPNGHYVAVVGYRQGGTMIKIADPAASRVSGRYQGAQYWMSSHALTDWIANKGYSAIKR